MQCSSTRRSADAGLVVVGDDRAHAQLEAGLVEREVEQAVERFGVALGGDVDQLAVDELGVRPRSRRTCRCPTADRTHRRCRASPSSPPATRGRRRHAVRSSTDAFCSAANDSLTASGYGESRVNVNVSGRGVTCGHTSRTPLPSRGVGVERLAVVAAGRGEQRAPRERDAGLLLQLEHVADVALLAGRDRHHARGRRRASSPAAPRTRPGRRSGSAPACRRCPGAGWRSWWRSRPRRRPSPRASTRCISAISSAVAVRS